MLPVIFRVNLLENLGRMRAIEQILEEEDMYKLLQSLGARKAGLLELSIERLTEEETAQYLQRQAKYRNETGIE